MHRGTSDAKAIYESLAIEDIQLAADVMRPVYDRTGRRDGFVSLEVSPYLADDTDRTVTEARRLFEAVARPNVMIKVPATEPGIPAIRTLVKFVKKGRDCITEIKKSSLQEKINDLRQQRNAAQKAGQDDRSRELHEKMRKMQFSLSLD